jgi:hypothetical protein
VLVAHHLPRPGAHLVTALARLHVGNLARGNSPEAWSTGWGWPLFREFFCEISALFREKKFREI